MKYPSERKLIQQDCLKILSINSLFKMAEKSRITKQKRDTTQYKYYFETSGSYLQ